MFNCLHHQTPQTGPLSLDELSKAKFEWVADCQRQVYWKEIGNLSHSGPNHKRTMLVRQLRLFLDSEGFIRCGGRIHNAPLSQLAKFPFCFRQDILSQHLSFTIHIQDCIIVESIAPSPLLDKPTGFPPSGSV